MQACARLSVPSNRAYEVKLVGSATVVLGVVCLSVPSNRAYEVKPSDMYIALGTALPFSTLESGLRSETLQYTFSFLPPMLLSVPSNRAYEVKLKPCFHVLVPQRLSVPSNRAYEVKRTVFNFRYDAVITFSTLESGLRSETLRMRCRSTRLCHLSVPSNRAYEVKRCPVEVRARTKFAFSTLESGLRSETRASE